MPIWFARLAKQRHNDLTMYEHLPNLGVTYFVLTDTANKTQWIAISGTVNLESTLVDLDVQLVNNKEIGIEIHSGFAETGYDRLQHPACCFLPAR